MSDKKLLQSDKSDDEENQMSDNGDGRNKHNTPVTALKGFGNNRKYVMTLTLQCRMPYIARHLILHYGDACCTAHALCSTKVRLLF
jgi:hypothetical protein